MKITKEVLKDADDWKEFVDSLAGAENPPRLENGPTSYPAIVIAGWKWFGNRSIGRVEIQGLTFIYPHDFARI